MKSKITSQQCAIIVEKFLSPIEDERVMASQLIFSLYATGKLDSELSQQSLDHVQDRSRFVCALVSYWARSSHVAFDQWMTSCGVESGEKENLLTYSVHEEHYPIKVPCVELPAFCFMSVSQWLANSLGVQDSEVIPQLLACLEYNGCEDYVVQMLEHMGEAAKSALPVLLDHLIEKGPRHSPNNDCRALVAIAGTDSVYFESMAKMLKAENPARMLQSFCGVFDEIKEPTHLLIDALLDVAQYFPSMASDDVWTFLACTARAAKRANYKMVAVRQLALPFVQSSDSNLRAVAANVLGEVHAEGEDDSLLVRLSEDNEWIVRDAGHHAAKNIQSPTAALVCATAKDLGCYDGYDGYPHYSALDTLVQWGEKSAPALTIILKWLEQDGLAFDDYCSDLTVDLIEKLGALALPLLPAMKAFSAQWIESNEGEYEEDAADDSDVDDAEFDAEDKAYDERQQQFEAFVRGVGLDHDEDIQFDDFPPEGFDRLLALVEKLSKLA